MTFTKIKYGIVYFLFLLRAVEASIAEIRSEAAKGLEAVVNRLNERLVDDRFNKMFTNYEPVYIGNFFAGISGQDKPEQAEYLQANH